MAKSPILRLRTAQDIDGRIERVLRGLGNPEPPLHLEQVRELLKLDRSFYTADDPTLVREVISRIRVATIQVAHRPMLLLDAIKKWSLQALYVPDKKRILLDASLPEKKHRWSEAHEIGHSLIPWHDDVMHGDNRHTLRQQCHEQVESEANFAAGRLLFLRDRFTAEAMDLPAELSSVRALHPVFGNTLSSTLWRFVETIGTDRPVVGMITVHPHVSRRPLNFDLNSACRHCIQSAAFAARFGQTSEQTLFSRVSSFCGAQTGGKLGSAEVVLADDNGTQHVFTFETFFIRYKGAIPGEALTLGVYSRPRELVVSRPID
ncbi:MAG: ImmA/IrrE family metallo-endopeptidase [Gemmatimonadaceae bacterium]